MRAGPNLLLLSFLVAANLACSQNSEEHTEKTPNDKAVVWIDGPSGKLCTYSAGAGGLPVVFVHSLAGDWQQWLAQIHHVSESRQAIAFDMRGHGKSVRNPGLDYSVGAQASDLAAVVDYYGLEKLVLVGNSFGGSVCAAYASENPGKVAAILFVNPVGDQRKAPQEQVQQFMQMVTSDRYEDVMHDYWSQILRNSEEDVKTRVISSMEATQREAVVGAFESMRQFDIVSALAGFDGPMTSVITDLNDTPHSLHNVLTNLPFRRVPGTSHWLHMDQPDAFNEMLDAFLEKYEL